MFAKVFNDEICYGLNRRMAIKTLQEAGYLEQGSDLHNAQQVAKPKGMKSARFYVINDTIFDERL